MSKPFNQLLHDDIIMLKGINREKFPEEYRRVFGNIMKRYSISRSTVYAELEKAIPGAYKKYETTSRQIIISKKEMGLVRDMIFTGKSVRYITRVMSLELGFRYTPYRIFKVKELLASAKTGEQGSSIPVVTGAASIASARLLEEEKNIKVLKQEEPPVVFKGNIRRLFYRLSMLDLIDPERRIKINISGHVYPCSVRVIKDCFSHIIYSIEEGGKSISGLCRFEMETILINELSQLKHGTSPTPAALRQLEGIRKSLLVTDPDARGKAPLNGGYDLDDVYRAICHFAPGTKRDDVAKFFETPPVVGLVTNNQHSLLVNCRAVVAPTNGKESSPLCV